jgi:predicted fused transcriptional regulator/phosphomethylpyrimidine kinase/predicted transcriptional regulator
MKFVEEVVVESFLPTVRAMLASALRERGLTQTEIAGLLGVSQSAVSKYAAGEVTADERIRTDERVRETVERVADGLAAGDLSRVEALVEIEALIRTLERGGPIGTMHADAVPGLDPDAAFDVHDPDGPLRTRERVRSSVRRGLRTLETGRVAGLIPAVGSNLVECLPDASGIDDVAGVPGRLFDVNGRIEVPGDPAFGVSEHVATVLLAARDAGHGARAALNVRYAPSVVDALRDRGLAAVEFDAGAEFDAAVGSAVADHPEASVLYQTGAHGVEPIVYLLGDGAPTVARLARDLVRAIEE